MYQGANVLSFFRARNEREDWTQHELAEFYRVESALVQAGMSVWTDRGVSDDGDPWLVFGRDDNEEVIAHFARIDGRYVIVSSILPHAVFGTDFNALVRELLGAHPYVIAKSAVRQHNVYLHPAALLTALLATAFAKTADLHDQTHSGPSGDERDQWSFLHRFELAIISAIALVVPTVEEAGDAKVNALERFVQQDMDAETVLASHSAVAVQDQKDIPSDSLIGSQNTRATVGTDQPAFTWQDANNDTVVQSVEGPTVLLVHPAWSRAEIHLAADSEVLPTSKQQADMAAVGVDERAASSPELAPNWASVDTVTIRSSNGALVELSLPVNSTGNSLSVNSTGNGPSTESVAFATSLLNFSPTIVFASTSLEDAVQQTLQVVGYSGGLSSVEVVDLEELVGSAPPSLVDASSSARASVEGASSSAPASVEGASSSAPASVEGASSSAPASVAGASSSAPASVAGASDVAAHSAVESHQGTGRPPASDELMRRIVDTFAKETPHIEVAVFGDDVIMVDADTTHISSAYEMLTWEMSDGSSLTIVGLIPHDVV